MALVFFGLESVLRCVGRPRAELLPLMFMCVAYSFFMMFEKYVPGVWYALQDVSISLCRVRGRRPCSPRCRRCSAPTRVGKRSNRLATFHCLSHRPEASKVVYRLRWRVVESG